MTLILSFVFFIEACRHFSIVDEELRHSLMKQLIQNGGTHFNPSAFGERPIHREQSLTNWKFQI